MNNNDAEQVGAAPPQEVRYVSLRCAATFRVVDGVREPLAAALRDKAARMLDEWARSAPTRIAP